MPQCRICFEEDNDLLQPCRCRGTAAYIHPACLTQYIHYYPDRVCRICRTQLSVPLDPESLVLLWLLGSGLTGLLFLSNARVITKIGLVAYVGAVSLYYARNGLLSRSAVGMALILICMFVTGGDALAKGLILSTLMLLAAFVSAAITIPGHIVAEVFGYMLVFAYLTCMFWVFQTQLDTYAFGVVLTTSWLVWYAWSLYMSRPRLARLHAE